MKVSGWGRYPVVNANIETFENDGDLLNFVEREKAFIVRGKGRSYGDAALSDWILFSDRFDKMLDFHTDSGILRCESGVTISDIIDIFLPRGWFLPVVPGTKFVSIGGAIAADVHGKNHHREGTFARFVKGFRLLLPDGNIVYCSHGENPELFHATCGGMGLTGVILDVSIQLVPVPSACIRETVIPCKDLEDVLLQFNNHGDATYSVAWIDCLAQGQSAGRSILMTGEFAQSGRRSQKRKRPFTIPADLPGFCLNRWSMSAFNRLYYKKKDTFVEGRLVDLDSFFFPLDRIHRWNRLYGRKGFVQYQFILPRPESPAGLRNILQTIALSKFDPFLTVLKLMGAQNENLLSFPMEGYTLTLDFKMEQGLFSFLNQLDDIVMKHGGRLYLAKDARMGKDIFKSGYPKWQQFETIRHDYHMNSKIQSLLSQRLGI